MRERERATDREESIMQSRNFAISSSLLRPGVIILMASTLSKRNGPINAAGVSSRHRHRSICGDFMARGASSGGNKAAKLTGINFGGCEHPHTPMFAIFSIKFSSIS
jgi:hypothetical protein